MLVQLVEDDLVLGAALQADDDPHAVAVGFVTELVAGDVGDDALVDELGDALDELRLVDLIGDLGDDDRLPAAGDVLDRALGAHHEAAAAGAVGVRDIGAAEEEPAGGEVGAEDVFEHQFKVGAVVLRRLRQQCNRRVHHFLQIVRRDVGRHADSDARGTIDDEVRDSGWQDGRFKRRFVVVRHEVDRVGVDVGEHLAGDAGQAGFRVTHRGRGIAVD